MKIDSLFGSSIQGMQRGIQGLRRVAASVAAGGQGERPASLERSMVEMQQQARQVQLSARVARAADETLGTLFDDRA